jgi:alpha-beta hydrolase superfamily lysophospholipase
LRRVDGPSIRRTESHLVVVGGRSLFRRSWLPPRPERLLVLVHGYAEHSGRYEHVGAWLAARGCAVHAYDQQGHGRSAGARGHVRRFSEFLDDLDAVLAAATLEQPGLPAFVVGHSMGGLVASAWAVERASGVLGVVTSGAALSVTGVPSRPRLLLLRALRRVTPRLAIDQPISQAALSRDPEVGRAYAADPLVFQRMTLSLAAELFAASGRTLARAGEVRVPMLLLHGGDDPLCPSYGSRAFFEQLAAPGSDLRIYPELRHEIFNEPEQEQVFADLLDWLRKQEAAR